MSMLRIKAIGTGTPGDPIRADFPTYGFVGYDPVTNLITVDVPDADFPPNAPAPGDATRPNTAYGPVLTTVPGASMAAWTNTLRARYPGRGANWSPPQPQ